MVWLLWILVIMNIVGTLLLLLTIGFVYNYSREVARQVGGHLNSLGSRTNVIEQFLTRVFQISSTGEPPADHTPSMKN